MNAANVEEALIKDPACDPENPKIVGFQEVFDSAERIRSGITKSPFWVSVSDKYTYLEYTLVSRC